MHRLLLAGSHIYLVVEALYGSGLIIWSLPVVTTKDFKVPSELDRIPIPAEVYAKASELATEHNTVYFYYEFAEPQTYIYGEPDYVFGDPARSLDVRGFLYSLYMYTD